jgi:hypothetical protein
MPPEHHDNNEMACNCCHGSAVGAGIGSYPTAYPPLKKFRTEGPAQIRLLGISPHGSTETLAAVALPPFVERPFGGQECRGRNIAEYGSTT